MGETSQFRFLIAAGLLSLASCTSDDAQQDVSSNGEDRLAIYDAAFDSEHDLLVFSVEDFEGGPINGVAVEEDFEDGISSVEKFRDALRGCGESKLLVDESGTHSLLVSVPTAENNPFRLDDMDDLELVTCVQNRVSFSFGAGIGRDIGVDTSKFESLYAQKN